MAKAIALVHPGAAGQDHVHAASRIADAEQEFARLPCVDRAEAADAVDLGRRQRGKHLMTARFEHRVRRVQAGNGLRWLRLRSFRMGVEFRRRLRHLHAFSPAAVKVPAHLGRTWPVPAMVHRSVRSARAIVMRRACALEKDSRRTRAATTSSCLHGVAGRWSSSKDRPVALVQRACATSSSRRGSAGMVLASTCAAPAAVAPRS